MKASVAAAAHLTTEREGRERRGCGTGGRCGGVAANAEERDMRERMRGRADAEEARRLRQIEREREGGGVRERMRTDTRPCGTSDLTHRMILHR